MLLKDLTIALRQFSGEADGTLDIQGITDDSRQVAAGFLFVAVTGVDVDGHRFISQALSAGASAIVGERPAHALALPSGVAYLRVPDARQALGYLHAAWYNFPARQLTLAGVTGTDGKTTTTNLLYAMLRAADLNAGMISTVNARIGDESQATGLHTTTPPAGEVQHYLAQMVAAGSTHAVLETTSHGLVQQRLAGCDFDVAVITNITHEHLDYHGSWEAYCEAKAMLFRGLTTAISTPTLPKISVLNYDDRAAYDYLRKVALGRQVSYSAVFAEADVVAQKIDFGARGTTFTIRSPWGTLDVTSPLVGGFNVSNILAASAAALALGIAPEAVAAGAAAVSGVPGRMQRIDAGQDFTAIVDFAHTPNALRRALEALRLLAAPGGRVIVVFGSAGLRDRQKRRMMGDVAAEMADLTVITAEDPRTESLDEIMAETALGLESAGKQKGSAYWLIPDRGAAILHAVSLARAGDVVVACGKGHEQSMCFGTHEYPWDDREAMRLALQGQALDTLPTAKQA